MPPNKSVPHLCWQSVGHVAPLDAHAGPLQHVLWLRHGVAQSLGTPSTLRIVRNFALLSVSCMLHDAVGDLMGQQEAINQGVALGHALFVDLLRLLGGGGGGGRGAF